MARRRMINKMPSSMIEKAQSSMEPKAMGVKRIKAMRRTLISLSNIVIA
jgi:hypothetical protein